MIAQFFKIMYRKKWLFPKPIMDNINTFLFDETNVNKLISTLNEGKLTS